MKKFEFTLEKYLEVKKGEEEKLKISIGNLNAQINDCLQKIKEIEQKEQSERSEYSMRCKQGTSGAKLQEYSMYMGHLFMVKRDLSLKLSKLNKKNDEYKSVIVKIMNEIKALNNMKQEQFNAYMKEIQIANDREIDEFVSYKVYSS